MLRSAAAAAAALVAGSVAKPRSVLAASGDPVTIDASNSGTGTTVLTTTSPSLPVAALVATAAGANGAIGVSARADSMEGKGVTGWATDVTGTLGPFGVWGMANNATGVGVLGYSGPNIEGPSYPLMSVGVYGWAQRDTNARAVWGTSTIGTGVRGESTTGTGVRAVATTGVALGVEGRVTMSRAGRTSIGKGKLFVDVFVAGGLAASAFIVATLQTYRGAACVASVRPNYPSASYMRIYLNKVASPTSSTVVGWVVIG